MALTLSMMANQKLTLVCSPKNDVGQSVPDTLTWSVDDPTLATLQPSTDTLQCVVLGTGKSGTVTVTATDGTISDSAVITVTSVKAASLNMASPFGPVNQ